MIIELMQIVKQKCMPSNQPTIVEIKINTAIPKAGVMHRIGKVKRRGDIDLSSIILTITLKAIIHKNISRRVIYIIL
jgi:hypothetical protein